MVSSMAHLLHGHGDTAAVVFGGFAAYFLYNQFGHRGFIAAVAALAPLWMLPDYSVARAFLAQRGVVSGVVWGWFFVRLVFCVAI